ncbi:PH domain-containing protein [Paracoccidioides lutzii Pb01]|uniref:PH domain-containing protein n=1 Tax=Paracoccidioides lutzii (strain ATCC MYA-826 / Pb01) TaxID=502779 RepID=C1HE69_PARBA|nr:PH domain-containing protein [Paracoccidioides lutzii Pb01]EEH40609.2 PH domain-containing protein [Paracoccidioides lutzii Pb01]
MYSVNLPHRIATANTVATTNTSLSDDEGIPDSDMSGATNILLERLQAWKHMCGYLENYVTTMQKVQRSQSKEFEKVLKTVSEPLKEAHHFNQSKDGVTGLFDKLRTNTEGLVNLHLETEKSLKTTVLPKLKRLRHGIKSKAKEIRHGASKGSKQVDKAHSTTQKHIEMLGQYTATFGSATGGKLDSSHDPYLLCRGTNYRLNKQVTEENNRLHEMLQVQNSFSQFEAHILETVRNVLIQIFQCMDAQTAQQRAAYADVVGAAQKFHPGFEWLDFYLRNESLLLNPNTAPRSISNATFPNQDHQATKALIEGTLERKSRAVIRGYSYGYYAVSPAGYLHGFKDNDDYRHDPTPDITLYLPECTVGHLDGVKFSVKGKDVSGGRVCQVFAPSSELSFKAYSKDEAEKWFRESGSGPASPTASPTVSKVTRDVHESFPLAQTSTEVSLTSPTPQSQQKEGLMAPQTEEVAAVPTPNPEIS